MDKKVQSRVQNQLEEMIANYKREALAYLLYFEANERDLSIQTKKELQQQYGKMLFSPKLDWNKYFDFLQEPSEKIIDNAVRSWLEEQNYTRESFLMPKDRLRNMLWYEARKQAHHILDKRTANNKE